jgi:hypothetical protein
VTEFRSSLVQKTSFYTRHNSIVLNLVLILGRDSVIRTETSNPDQRSRWWPSGGRPRPRRRVSPSVRRAMGSGLQSYKFDMTLLDVGTFALDISVLQSKIQTDDE